MFHEVAPTTGGAVEAVRYLRVGVHVPSLYLKGMVDGENMADGIVKGTLDPRLVGVNVNLFSFPTRPRPMELRGDPAPPV